MALSLCQKYLPITDISQKIKTGTKKIDTDYDYSNEILKQLEILENSKTKCRNIS